jgi:hypothetical protein
MSVDEVRDRIQIKNLVEDMDSIESMLDMSEFEAAKLEMKLVNMYIQINIAHSIKRIADTISVTQL